MNSKWQNANSSLPFPPFSYPSTSSWLSVQKRIAPTARNSASSSLTLTGILPLISANQPQHKLLSQKTTVKSKETTVDASCYGSQPMRSGVLEVKGSLHHYRASKFPSPRGVLSREAKPASDHTRYFLPCPAVIPEDVLQMFVFV